MSQPPKARTKYWADFTVSFDFTVEVSLDSEAGGLVNHKIQNIECAGLYQEDREGEISEIEDWKLQELITVVSQVALRDRQDLAEEIVERCDPTEWHHETEVEG